MTTYVSVLLLLQQQRSNIAAQKKGFKMSKSKRTTNGLREVLFDQVDGLISGTITPQQAKAVSGIASQIVAVTKLEMEAARFISSTPNGDNIKKIKAVQL